MKMSGQWEGALDPTGPLDETSYEVLITLGKISLAAWVIIYHVGFKVSSQNVTL